MSQIPRVIEEERTGNKFDFADTLFEFILTQHNEQRGSDISIVDSLEVGGLRDRVECRTKVIFLSNGNIVLLPSGIHTEVDINFVDEDSIGSSSVDTTEATYSYSRRYNSSFVMLAEFVGIQLFMLRGEIWDDRAYPPTVHHLEKVTSRGFQDDLSLKGWNPDLSVEMVIGVVEEAKRIRAESSENRTIENAELP